MKILQTTVNLLISFSKTDGHTEEKYTAYPLIFITGIVSQGIFVSNKRWENIGHFSSRENLKKKDSECGKVHASDAVIQALQLELPLSVSVLHRRISAAVWGVVIEIK